MRGKSYWIFSENCHKISTANAQIWIFLKKCKCKGIFFVTFIGFPAVSRIQVSPHWLSRPIRSEVTVDQTSQAAIVAYAGLKTKKTKTTQNRC